jgi:hypothetical protein
MFERTALTTVSGRSGLGWIARSISRLAKSSAPLSEKTQLNSRSNTWDAIERRLASSQSGSIRGHSLARTIDFSQLPSALDHAL